MPRTRSHSAGLAAFNRRSFQARILLGENSCRLERGGGERFLPNRAYLTPDINFRVGLTSSAKTNAAAKGTRALIPNSRGSGIEA